MEKRKQRFYKENQEGLLDMLVKRLYKQAMNQIQEQGTDHILSVGDRVDHIICVGGSIDHILSVGSSVDHILFIGGYTDNI